MSENEEQQVNTEGEQPYVPQYTAVDTEAALAAYQHKKTVEGLMGPLVSLVVHVVCLGSLLLFYEPDAPKVSKTIEIETKELEIKELDKKALEELQELEEIAQEMVPTVEKPTVSVDASVDVGSVADFSDAMASTDNATDFSDVLDIRANDSPLKISSLYGGRSNEGREKTRKKFGGSDATEIAVLKALRWLKKTQSPNGSWAPSEQEAMTGLALLTFLAHGETPSPDNEEFGETVQRGMQWLADRINALNKPPADYRNGIAAYALSEAYGMTKVPFLKPPMEKALQWLVDGQQKSGGYDYGYKKDARWDLSVACWQFQAMKAGYVAGAEVKGLEDAIEKGIKFMKNVTYDKKTQKFGYSSPGSGSDGLQGAAVLCLQLLGDASSVEAKNGVKYISDNMDGKCKVAWVNPKKKVDAAHQNELYAWYYQTQAMFHAGKNTWKSWNAMFAPEFIKYQNPEGYWECPNADKKLYKVAYDKWYTTCLAALSLQVYYRYLPTYKMPKGIAKTEKTTMQKLDDDLGLDL